MRITAHAGDTGQLSSVSIVATYLSKINPYGETFFWSYDVNDTCGRIRKTLANGAKKTHPYLVAYLSSQSKSAQTLSRYLPTPGTEHANQVLR
jgi:hypothetical protein